MADYTVNEGVRVAIVGAGIAGLACADRLRRSGINPVLFDKGKRPGGRLSTLRIDAGEWDFGAQYIAPDQTDFAAKLADWQQAGVLSDWPGGPPGALVGIPAMASLVEAEAANLEISFGVQVQSLRHSAAGWSLMCAGAVHGPFDTVVLAVPAEQAAPLLSLHDLVLAREAAASRSRPCWTVMAGFDSELAGLPDVIERAGPVAWAARNNSKPGRPARECWVLQADSEWSQRHLEDEAPAVAEQIMAAFASAVAPQGLPPAHFLKAHRWRFALSHAGNGTPHWNARLKLGACGDWCAAPHVAGAWRSGTSLAERILASRRGVAAEQFFTDAN